MNSRPAPGDTSASALRAMTMVPHGGSAEEASELGKLLRQPSRSSRPTSIVHGVEAEFVQAATLVHPSTAHPTC